jgi:3-dehydroquinate dehydratase / shikimate dehydrogenase
MSSRALLCVTVGAASLDDLRAQRDAAAAIGDLVELRLDLLERPDPEGALQGRRGPVVVTCRPVWEGGRFGGSEEERRHILEAASDLGAEYVDVEWRAGFVDLISRRRGHGLVLSIHDFGGVPPDLADQVRQMRATGADVIKVAVLARRLSDMRALLEIGRGAASGSRSVLVAMGSAGLASRILATRFGSCWTYAGPGFAPGQVTAERLLREFRFRAITADTKVYGVAGRPLAHSLSPVMHNRAFEEAGHDAVFVPLEAADANDFFQAADALDLQGAAVTAPHKRALFEQVASVDGLTRQVGALNTLRRRGAGWEGMNTDVPGFLAPLDRRLELSNLRVAVLGAGGAARAVAVAVASRGARARIHARNAARAAVVASDVGGIAAGMPPAAGSWDVLVNATPVGTFPQAEESPMHGQPFDGRLVYDLVYNPVETRLLREARQAGCETIGGLEMLIEQACLQFAWWTGRAPRSDTLRAAALERLQAEQPVSPEKSVSGCGTTEDCPSRL